MLLTCNYTIFPNSNNRDITREMYKTLMVLYSIYKWAGKLKVMWLSNWAWNGAQEQTNNAMQHR